MLLAANQALRHPRRRMAALVAVLALSAGVVFAHSGLGMDHMGDDQAVCIAVIESALAITVVALAARPVPRRRPGITFGASRPAWSYALPAPAPRARAGPPLLQVFRL